MSRTLVAVVLVALLAGGAASAAAVPPAGGEAAPKTFEVRVQGAPIPEVIRTAIACTGAHIAMDGDVTGAITLDAPDFTVDTLLEKICAVKGCYWWSDAPGSYVISTHPRKTEAQTQAVPDLPRKRPEMNRSIKLQFISPQFLVYQLGLSDYPGPEETERDPGYREAMFHTFSLGAGELHGMGMAGGPGGGAGFGGGTGGAGRGSGGGARASGVVRSAGGGGPGLGGDLGTFLPEGITQIVAFPMLNSLLVRGTEDGIDKFIEFLKLIDKKPQQILIEIQSVLVSSDTAKAFGFQWFWIDGSLTIQPGPAFGSASGIKIGYNPPGTTNFRATLTYLLQNSQGKVTDAIRVATMNLVTASNSVTTQYPIVTTSSSVSGGILPVTSTSVNVQFLPVSTVISITPRINGDGTVTMTIPYSKSDVTSFVEVPTGIGSQSTTSIPITTTTAINTTLNVRDGETMVLGGFVGNRDMENQVKVPLLGDLPVIGRLFTKRTHDVSESETLIFITPRIIKEEAAPSTFGVI